MSNCNLPTASIALLAHCDKGSKATGCSRSLGAAVQDVLEPVLVQLLKLVLFRVLLLNMLTLWASSDSPYVLFSKLSFESHLMCRHTFMNHYDIFQSFTSSFSSFVRRRTGGRRVPDGAQIVNLPAIPVNHRALASLLSAGKSAHRDRAICEQLLVKLCPGCAPPFSDLCTNM